MISREAIIKQMRAAMQFVYVIRNTNFQDVWYLCNMRQEPSYHGLIWTPYMMQAKAFPTEESVEEFKSLYVSPRKVEILKIDVKAIARS